MNDNMMDQNYPVISLKITSQSLENAYGIMENVENYINDKPGAMNESCVEAYEDLPDDKKDYIVFFYYNVVECSNTSASELTDRRLAKRILKNTDISLSLSEENVPRLFDIEIMTVIWVKLDQFVVIKAGNRKFSKSNKIFDIIHKNNKSSEMIEYILLHSQPIPHLNDLTILSIKSQNYSLVVSKIIRTYLEPPFGECSQYLPNTGQPYNAISFMQCYRQCTRDYFQKIFNCSLLFTDYSINDLDFNPISNPVNVCRYQTYLDVLQYNKSYQVFQYCKHFCPKDCLTIDYLHSVHRTDTYTGNEFWHKLNESERYYRKSLIWDSTQPMIAYNEESVMSFTDYLINCGGLLGLYYGLNVKDFILLVINFRLSMSFWKKIKEHSLIVFNIVNNFWRIVVKTFICLTLSLFGLMIFLGKKLVQFHKFIINRFLYIKGIFSFYSNYYGKS